MHDEPLSRREFSKSVAATIAALTTLSAVVEACATLPTAEQPRATRANATQYAAIPDLLRELAVVNQDFRESVKMISPALRPTVVFHRFGESPMSRQDIRIKRRYIM